MAPEGGITPSSILCARVKAGTSHGPPEPRRDARAKQHHPVPGAAWGQGHWWAWGLHPAEPGTAPSHHPQGWDPFHPPSPAGLPCAPYGSFCQQAESCGASPTPVPIGGFPSPGAQRGGASVEAGVQTRPRGKFAPRHILQLFTKARGSGGPEQRGHAATTEEAPK